MRDRRKGLDVYPPTEPYHRGRLRVSERHELYFEQVGRENGVPVLFLHGGPGGGIEPGHRRFFDPAHYRAILFDQRGCGRSTPYADLVENTTWDLVADIEKLRRHLGVERWILFGGSWGSTLALLYAETHPERVLALCLRGIFLCRRKEIRWFYQEGASFIFPDAFEPYRDLIPEAERHDFVAAYHARLTSDDRAVRLRAARAWSVWEGATSRLVPDAAMTAGMGEDAFAEAFARIEAHYFHNGIWMRDDNQILDDIGRIRGLPCEIVHGRYDVVCPLENAWALHQAWPGSALHVVPDAGHSAREPGIALKLVEAMERFKGLS